MKRLFLLASLLGICLAAPPPKGWMGVSLGGLNGGGVLGEAFVVNASTIQIRDFTLTAAGNLAFVFEKNNAISKVTEVFIENSKSGFLNPISSTLGQNDKDRIVLNAPEFINSFDRFGVYDVNARQFVASVSIPSDLQTPEPQTLNARLVGKHYRVSSGNIVVLDRKTLIIPNFVFDGHKPPDGYVFLGKGSRVHKSAGKKVHVRNWDTEAPQPISLRQPWNNVTIIADLTEDMDIYDQDWISIYCFAVGVDFGHVRIPQLNDNIPPPIPPVAGARIQPWPETTVQGTTFDLYLGSPGRKRGYESLRGAKPNQWVWYVNGKMSPKIVVSRGVKITFRVHGSSYWKAYLSNEPSGGYNIKPANEKPLVTIYAKQEESAKQLCWYGRKNVNDNPDSYDDFETFRNQLYVRCKPEQGNPGIFTWTPDRNTPDEVFYGALDQYDMGWKIKVQN